MSNINIKRVSKLMSLILRHRPEHIRAALDKNGWLLIDDLINGINKKGIRLDRKLLEVVVEENDKKRFIISDDGLKIRANQGHSVNVDLELKTVQPPEFLFHGTVPKFMDAIQDKGLLKMSRQHVHLSTNRDTAISVGSRRGKPVILTVRSGEMHENGNEFFLSENGVWLTEAVAPEYIEFK